MTADDAFKRLLAPALSNEALNNAKEKADELAERLNSGVYNTTGENSPLALNRQALRMCEDATSEKGTRDAAGDSEMRCLAPPNERPDQPQHDEHQGE